MEGLLDDELQTMIYDYQRSVTALQGVADALPGFGLVTAILGVILTMQVMDSPSIELGMQVASALVGSFLGILALLRSAQSAGSLTQPLHPCRNPTV